MTAKSIVGAFLSSVLFHGLAGASFYWVTQNPGAPSEDVIIATLIESPVAVVDKVTKPAVKKSVAQKRYPKQNTPKAVKPAEIQLPDPQHSAVPAQAAQAAPTLKTSTELLADPKKGKVFSVYFASVKEKIFKTLTENYGQQAGAGDISLYFVLNSDGRLFKVSALEKDSTPDAALKQLAIECLKKASPFERFPTSLDSSQIAFQVKILFDESNG